jgi:hypothetical protein
MSFPILIAGRFGFEVIRNFSKKLRCRLLCIHENFQKVERILLLCCVLMLWQVYLKIKSISKLLIDLIAHINFSVQFDEAGK